LAKACLNAAACSTLLAEDDGDTRLSTLAVKPADTEVAGVWLRFEALAVDDAECPLFMILKSPCFDRNLDYKPVIDKWQECLVAYCVIIILRFYLKAYTLRIHPTYFLKDKMSKTSVFSYVQRSSLIFIGLIGSLSARADINTSGPQINAYVGTTMTNVSPHTINLNGETDSLNPNAQNYATFASGLGAAYRFVMPDVSTGKPYGLHDFSIGLDYFSPIQLTQYGETLQYQVPTYNNYNYRLSVKSQRLMLDGEWTFHPIGERLYPFVETGVGVAQNTTSYSDTPVAPEYGPSLTLNEHTQNQFAYALGVGLKWALTSHLNTSLRYLYTDLGDASTANTGSLSIASPLNVALTTQTLLFGLSYAF
jgi:opacity protein-like surface antigen